MMTFKVKCMRGASAHADIRGHKNLQIDLEGGYAYILIWHHISLSNAPSIQMQVLPPSRDGPWFHGAAVKLRA
jgi:hypothetical protein